MANITFKGNPIKTIGTLPQIGSTAPDFLLTAQDLSDVPLSKYKDKIKLLNIVPSLDTTVCSASAKKFHNFLKDRDDVVFINVSMDLPFAQARFCKAESLKTEECLSSFRSNFAEDYGVLITESPMKGLCSRAVVVLDQNNKVMYTQQVPEITHEPDYNKVMNILH
mgnify:CR=1 FL=1